MSVALTFTIALHPLQRVQPIDPVWQGDWSAQLTGDASGGVSNIFAQVPLNVSCIPEFLSGFDNSGVATSSTFQLNMGRQPGPAAPTQTIAHTGQVVAAVAGQTAFAWEPPRTMVTPDLGQQVVFLMQIANPGAAELHTYFGRCYCWPRSEVIDLPQRTFWPYLTH